MMSNKDVYQELKSGNLRGLALDLKSYYDRKETAAKLKYLEISLLADNISDIV